MLRGGLGRDLLGWVEKCDWYAGEEACLVAGTAVCVRGVGEVGDWFRGEFWSFKGGYVVLGDSLWRKSGGRTCAGKVAWVGTLFAGTGCEGEERDGENVGELHFVGVGRVIWGWKGDLGKEVMFY